MRRKSQWLNSAGTRLVEQDRVRARSKPYEVYGKLFDMDFLSKEAARKELGDVIQPQLGTHTSHEIDFRRICLGQVRTLLDNFDGDALGMWRTAGRVRSAWTRSSSSRIARN